MNQIALFDESPKPNIPPTLKLKLSHFDGDYSAWLSEQLERYGDKSKWPKWSKDADEDNRETVRQLKFFQTVWCA